MKLNKVVFIIVGVLILGGLFFIFKPKPQQPLTESSPKNEQQTQQKPDLNEAVLVIQKKKLISTQDTIKVNQNSEVTIKITSDEEEEFHLHGYDKSIKLEPGKQVTLTFTANLSGRFPFELEESQTELGALEVQPQ